MHTQAPAAFQVAVGEQPANVAAAEGEVANQEPTEANRRPVPAAVVGAIGNQRMQPSAHDGFDRPGSTAVAADQEPTSLRVPLEVGKIDERRTPPPVTPGANAERRTAESSARLETSSAPDHRSVPAPALARAAEVDSAVRVEQTTGAAPAIAIDGADRATKAAPAFMVAEGAGGESPTSSERARPDQPQFTSRVLRGLSAMLNQRGGTMTMQLDPPDLGKLRIQMTITRGAVAAEFHATTAGAQRMLEQSLTTLRTALEGQGLTVERLQVHHSTMQHQHTGADAQQQSHTDAGDGQSRGRGDGRHHPHRSAERDLLFDSIFDELHRGHSEAGSPLPAGAAA